MEKLGMWLLVLIAVVFLARPQGTEAANNSEIIASAECIDNNSENESEIILVVILLIIIGTAYACGSEETHEN